MKTYRTLIKLASCSIIFITSGCGAGGNYIPRDSIATSVESFKVVSPANSLAIGNKLKLTPLILQANGQLPINPNVIWSVSDSKVASIATDGTLTALADGNVTVTANFNGQQAVTTISVTKLPDGGTGTYKDPKNPTIQANPALLSLIKNIVVKLPAELNPVADYNLDSIEGTLPFVVTAYDENNKPLSGITFTWSSSNEGVAKVDNKGTVTGFSTGSTNIIATAGDKISNIARVIILNGKANINVNFQGD